MNLTQAQRFVHLHHHDSIQVSAAPSIPPCSRSAAAPSRDPSRCHGVPRGVPPRPRRLRSVEGARPLPEHGSAPRLERNRSARAHRLPPLVCIRVKPLMLERGSDHGEGEDVANVTPNENLVRRPRRGWVVVKGDGDAGRVIGKGLDPRGWRFIMARVRITTRRVPARETAATARERDSASSLVPAARSKAPRACKEHEAKNMRLVAAQWRARSQRGSCASTPRKMRFYECASKPPAKKLSATNIPATALHGAPTKFDEG